MTMSDSTIQTGPTIRLQGVLQEVCVHGAIQNDQAMEQQAEQAEQQLAAGLGEIALATEALQAAGRQFAQRQTEFFQAAEAQLLDLAVEIARKILAQEIDAEKYKIDPIVTEALSSVSSRGEMVVRLNPADLAQCALAESSGKQEDGQENIEGIRFLADPTINRAECVIETVHGVVTSSVEHQLAEISQAFKNPE